VAARFPDTPVPVNPRPGTDKPTVNRGRFKGPWLAVAGLMTVLLLLFAGFRGRQEARRQAQLEDIMEARNQLQYKLEAAHLPPDRPGGPVSRPEFATLSVPALVNVLKSWTRNFEYDHVANGWSEDEQQELRLSQAVLANAEQRFSDALLTMTTEHEERSRKVLSSDALISRHVRLLRVRGDAYYGLRQWQSALDRYRELLRLRPHRQGTQAKIAQCEAALGQAGDPGVQRSVRSR